jgi:bifunctional DNase/RNase
MNKLGRSFLMWAVVGFSLGIASAAAEDGPKTAVEAADVRVQSVEVVFSQVGPVVLLKFRNKAVPVFVDSLVAGSIQGALAGQKPPRPLSHDLMHTILESLDAKVSQVVITQKEGIFYGALTIMAGKAPKVFDSRSSDAIALAIRFKAPILVHQSLVDSFGVELPEARGKQM